MGIKTMPATVPPMAPMTRRVLAGEMKELSMESFEWTTSRRAPMWHNYSRSTGIGKCVRKRYYR